MPSPHGCVMKATKTGDKVFMSKVSGICQKKLKKSTFDNGERFPNHSYDERV